MPRLTTLVSAFIAAILCGSILAAGGNLGAPPARVGLNVDMQPTLQSINKMPLAFTKNMGQWDDRVLFRANSGGATMWFTKEGVTYQFTRTISRRGDPMGRPDQIQRKMGDSPSRPYDRFSHEKDSIDQLVLTAKFVNANPNPEIIAEGQMEYKCNYLLGNDPSNWHTDVPNYEAITLKDIYPGIDLKYSGRRGNGQAAYEFFTAPGADIAQIKFAYDGAEATSIDSDGRLILKTEWGDMTAGIKSPEYSPRPVGEGLGVRAVLSGTTTCAWLTSSSTTPPPDLAHGDVRQAQSSPASRSPQAVELVCSTFLGGAGGDRGVGIAVDAAGSAYVIGVTGSLDFPTQNAYDGSYNGNDDVFVSKFSAAGNTLVYSAYLGGSDYDDGRGIAVDAAGSAYVTGYTSSSDFPTLNAYDGSFNTGIDVFVGKFSAAGNALVYSTFLGGSDWDYGYGIAVDAAGSAYVTGETHSSNFPTQNAYDGSLNGNYDVFVSKFSAAGNTLLYSTYLGGSGYDHGSGIAVDTTGSAYVIGHTGTSDFPAQNAYDGSYNGNYDVFVSKFSAAGNTLVYSTFLGGSDWDYGNGIAVDAAGSAYVTGDTHSSDFPTQNAYDGSLSTGFEDVFVSKFSTSGDALVYSTYLGGWYRDEGYGIAVDAAGSAYVTGETHSSNFPTQNAYAGSLNGYWDAFVSKFSAAGNTLVYSTFLGGSDYDDGIGIAVDAAGGSAYVTGYTESSDFPTQNAFDRSFDGNGDAFVTKLHWTPDYSCGDVNTDEKIDLLDPVFLINYIFVSGPAPQQLPLADVNCDGSINIADVVLLINYIFRSGPAPCAECD